MRENFVYQNIRINLIRQIQEYQRQVKDDSGDHFSSYLFMHSGYPVDLMNPQLEGLTIHDVASALSKECRFGGHISKFYSVAEHMINCEDLLVHNLSMELFPERIQKSLRYAVFMHDAHEAIMKDLPTPIKNLCPGYKDMELKVQKAVCERFGVEFRLMEDKMVKSIDFFAFEIERKFLQSGAEPSSKLSVPEGFEIKCMHPEEAKDAFLERYSELQPAA